MSVDVKALPGQETLLASWAALARTSPGAWLEHSAEAVAAVFPAWAPLNNAIPLGDRDPATLSRLTSLYAGAGVGSWALWVAASATDLDAPDAVREVGGLKRDTSTLVMTGTLALGLPSHVAVVPTSIATATRASDEPVPVAEIEEPDGVPGLAAWVLVHDGAAVSAAWSYLHERDCGICTVGTVPIWRRKGMARALLQHVLADAVRHGAGTASLQSTRMGQGLYASLGFVPVGRYEEWVSSP